MKSATDGVYQFLEIPPATYVLTVTVAGFATIKQDNVTLQVSQPATLDITLQVAGTTEVVEVWGAAPLVNVTDASQGQRVQQHPTHQSSIGRPRPVSILSLQAGVTYLGNTNQDSSKPNQTEDSRAGAVAGARSDQTNVTVDGLDNNDQLQGYAFQGAQDPLDSIQEFRVTTTNSNADSGRSSGAQVNMVTKSGTNSLHGTLYEYNRSNIGQANDWFNKQAEVKAGRAQCARCPASQHFRCLGRRSDHQGSFLLLRRLTKDNGPMKPCRPPSIVPSAALQQGIIQYPCGSDPPVRADHSGINWRALQCGCQRNRFGDSGWSFCN